MLTLSSPNVEYSLAKAVGMIHLELDITASSIFPLEPTFFYILAQVTNALVIDRDVSFELHESNIFFDSHARRPLALRIKTKKSLG